MVQVRLDGRMMLDVFKLDLKNLLWVRCRY